MFLLGAETYQILCKFSINIGYRMGATATWRIFQNLKELKISVIFSEPLGEEILGKILNEKNMPYCMSTHAITWLSLIQKISNDLLWYCKFISCRFKLKQNNLWCHIQ